VMVFVALLVVGAVIGGFVVPARSPDPGALPPAASPATRPTTSPAGLPTPSGLPTPPARPADVLALWAGKVGAAIDAPPVAVQAYGYAQLHMQGADPQCHLGWTTLAGIAEVESHHGQAGGAVLERGGRSSPLIVGPVLDGQQGRPHVPDSDAGAFDGDATFDRAMGPLRLLPAAWRAYAIDADSDGVLDPYDIDDATLTLARLLCSGNEDLNERTGWNAAVARFRAGEAYAQSVFQAADGYGQRTKDIG
jgi:membrane-bound lytic murein transglycosylase B